MEKHDVKESGIETGIRIVPEEEKLAAYYPGQRFDLQPVSDYSCKIADLRELEECWDYDISVNEEKEKWRYWKEEGLRLHREGKRIVYLIQKDGRTIGQAQAALSKEACSDPEMLVDKETAYLSAFRMREGYRGRGLFTVLYRFMESDLAARGYKRLTLGVEANDYGLKNLEIYRHYGFDTFVGSGFEEEPPDPSEPEPVVNRVNYYSKRISS